MLGILKSWRLSTNPNANPALLNATLSLDVPPHHRDVFRPQSLRAIFAGQGPAAALDLRFPYKFDPSQ